MMIKKLAVAVMAMNLCACTAFFNDTEGGTARPYGRTAPPSDV